MDKNEVAIEIRDFYMANPASGKEFEADSKSAYEKFIGKPWSIDEVKVVVTKSDTIYCVMPPPPGIMDDKTLADVSGGRLVDGCSFGTTSTFPSCAGTASSLGWEPDAPSAEETWEGDSTTP